MNLAETYLSYSKRVTTAEKMFLAEEYGLDLLMVCDRAIIFRVYYVYCFFHFFQAFCFDNIATLQEIKSIEVNPSIFMSFTFFFLRPTQHSSSSLLN